MVLLIAELHLFSDLIYLQMVVKLVNYMLEEMVEVEVVDADLGVIVEEEDINLAVAVYMDIMEEKEGMVVFGVVEDVVVMEVMEVHMEEVEVDIPIEVVMEVMEVHMEEVEVEEIIMEEVEHMEVMEEIYQFQLKMELIQLA